MAGGGRLRRAWPQINAALEKEIGGFELRQTGDAGDAAIFAHAFALSGYSLVIAVGGDGTVSEVADGLLMAGQEGAELPELGIVPCGSGSDFARSLGIAKGAAMAAKRIAAGAVRSIDVGRVSYVDDHGRLARRHFINIASLGVSGPAARAVNEDRRKGRVSATALFYWRTVSEFIRYRFQHVRIRVDNGDPIEGAIGVVAVSNGKFFGSGMMIAPDAVLDDGLFDVVILRGAGKLKLVWDIRLLYGGRHRNHPAITILRGRRVNVEPLGDPDVNGALVEVDGECLGRIPATFEMVPRGLKLRL